MNRVLASLLVLLTAHLVVAGPPRTVPQEILDAIVDDDPNPLPRNLAPAELLLRLPLERTGSDRAAPPPGNVYCPAEFEQNDGMLIRWGSFNDVLTEMTVGITTGDPDAIVYVVVSSASQENSASSTLAGAGADMNQVQFLITSTNSVWIRDYGPRFIREDANRAIIDHTYNRPRPLDNNVPGFVAGQWSEPLYHIGLEHGGGNFHLFANGEAFTSDLIVNENPSLTEQQIIDRYRDYQNLDLTVVEGFPTNIDGTQHIDMWMLPVSDNAVIIGEYPGTSTYPAKRISDDTAADFAARGYTVYRTPGWNSGSGGYNGTHYTYTNAVVMNDVVAIPRFGGSYAAEDTQALAVFQAAFPDRHVFTVDCSGIIHSAGAIHCIVMHVPQTLPAPLVTPELDFNALGDVGGPFTPPSRTYVLENTTTDPIDYAVTVNEPWLDTTSATGTLAGGTTANVVLDLNAMANTLGYGVYVDTVTFENLTDGNGDTERSVTLKVQADPPAIVTNALPDGTVGEDYGPLQIALNGGQPVIAWDVVPTLDYPEMDLATSGFAETGVDQGWQGDDNIWTYVLPFTFPFYGQDHSLIRISANGWINFGTHTGSGYSNSTATLIANARIAPLWDDLKTSGTGNGVFLDTSIDSEITIRWKGTTYAGNHPVNFAATLRETGEIVLHYGAGNDPITATVGISSGDGTHYTIASHDGLGSLTGANSLSFAMLPSLPAGVTLSASGELGGVPTEAGTFNPTFRVTDGLNRSDQRDLLLTIAAAPTATGDHDEDGDVDLADFAALQACSGLAAAGSCGTAFEFVLDGVIDSADYAVFASVLQGPQ